MKYICKKRVEPANFSRWKKCNKTANWSDFSGTPEHRELANTLIQEQRGLCCYCEIAIKRKKSHIEHLKPKGQPLYKKTMFVYGNLMASCNEQDSCGIKKGSWYDPKMVSPLDPKCFERFTYTFDGKIVPFDQDDSWALETIERLGLNCPRLRDRRKSIIKALDNNGEGPDPDYIKRCAVKNLEEEKEWPFGFYTILIFVAEFYGVQIKMA